MKNFWDLKKVFTNLEPEGQGRGIIMGVTRLFILGPFYYIQTNFLYFFAQKNGINQFFIQKCQLYTPIIIIQKSKIFSCDFNWLHSKPPPPYGSSVAIQRDDEKRKIKKLRRLYYLIIIFHHSHDNWKWDELFITNLLEFYPPRLVLLLIRIPK